MQIGSIGLIKAIKKFDFSYNVALSTYAVTYIIGEIKRFFRDDGAIKISRETKALAAKVQKEREKNENIKISELAKKLNASKENVILAIESTNSVETLDGKLDEDGFCLMDKIASKESSEEKLVSKIALKESLQKLNERDKKIIYLRYFKGQTQANVAKIIGMSQVQVSRSEKRILNSLEKELSSWKIITILASLLNIQKMGHIDFSSQNLNFFQLE